jgi:hypothetical protein
VLGPDLVARVVEVDVLAGLKVGGGEGKPHFVGAVEPVEVDEALEGAPQRRVVVEGDIAGHPGKDRPQARIAVPEDARAAERGGQSCVCAVVDLPAAEAGRCRPGGVLRRLGPERLEPLEAALRRVADEDGAGDRTNRGAHDPLRPDTLLVQALVGAGEVRAKRVAAAEH